MRTNAKKKAAARKSMLLYVSRIPEVLPEGKFLVHNRVTAQPHIGKHGFRAWLADDTTGMIVCNCGFAGLENSARHVHYTDALNAGRPHWIKLPNDDAVTEDVRAELQGQCINPSSEIEMAVRQLFLMLPDGDSTDAEDWLNDLLQLQKFWDSCEEEEREKEDQFA